MKYFKQTLIAALVTCFGLSDMAYGLTIENAMDTYRSKNYEDSALSFYDVYLNDIDADNRDKAEIYLAESLYKLELYMPAYYFYANIFKTGPNHRYYLNAIQGLLKTREKLRDNYIIPALINQGYNGQQYGRLPAENINEINYLIGSLTYHQGKYDEASAFLESIPGDAGLRFHQGRYLLGLMALQRGDEQRAIQLFTAISDTLTQYSNNADKDWEFHRIWQLSTLAVARILYGQGRFQEAADWYNKIPRFDSMWYVALAESAWNYFQLDDHGHALGQLQSLNTPFFEKHHLPEAAILQATTYYVNCQWDRVRNTLSEFKKRYAPALKTLGEYINNPQDMGTYYRDVAATGNHKFDPNIAREVRRSQKFLDFNHMLEHLNWEERQALHIHQWRGSHLQQDVLSIVKQYQEDLTGSVGLWTRSQLEFQYKSLQNLMNQADIIEFEVVDTEKRWLEAGQNIMKGHRARLPRPDIPSDQWQHWNASSEHWIDEVGFYVHSVKSECIEGM